MKNSRLASWKTALPFLLPSLAGFVVFSIIPNDYANFCQPDQLGWIERTDIVQ